MTLFVFVSNCMFCIPTGCGNPFVQKGHCETILPGQCFLFSWWICIIIFTWDVNEFLHKAYQNHWFVQMGEAQKTNKQTNKWRPIKRARILSFLLYRGKLTNYFCQGENLNDSCICQELICKISYASSYHVMYRILGPSTTLKFPQGELEFSQ